MGKLQQAKPRFAFMLGFLLLGVFPTDIVTSVSMGSYLAAHDEPWWHGLGFVFLTLLLLGIPAILLLLMGERGRAMLPRVRDWMNTNSWIIGEGVIALFMVLVISDLASG
jgi:hypothetical protein